MKWLGLLATAVLVTSSIAPDPAAAQRKKKNRYPTAAEMTAQMERERLAGYAERDNRIAQAHAAGKVILITRTMNLDRVYSFSEISDNLATKMVFNANYSSRTKWVKRGDPSAYASIGNSQHKTGAGDPVMNFADKSSLDEMYQIYIIEPGDYDLIGHSNFLRMTTAPAVHWATAGQTVPLGLGKVSMKESQFEETYRETQWEDTRYQTRTVTDQYCTSVYVHGGGCAYWGSSKRDITEVTQPAGYYNAAVVKMMPAVAADFELSRPFASFSAGAGDVIVVDGMFADYPNADFTANGCLRRSTDQVECGLNNYSLIQLPASVAGANRALASVLFNYPKLATIAPKARPAPMKIFGMQGGTPSKWGPRFIVTNGKQAAQ